MSVESVGPKGLEDLLNSDRLTIIDFWADWCGPCKALAPLLDSLSDKYEGTVKIAKINVAKHPEVGAEYSIVSIPCLIVFKDGKEIDRAVGFKGKEGLEELLSKHTKGS